MSSRRFLHGGIGPAASPAALLPAALVFAAHLCAAPGALADEPSPAQPADGGALADIVVTAQKREQKVQDVGIAIQAYTGDQLREFNVRDSYDVAAFTPGVSISGNLAGQNTQFTIRGVTQNDYNDIVESPNAVYLDDGYIAIAQGDTFAVLDVERVEVQQGPQGTLFGRNATGGLIQYISNKPTLDRYEGFADVRVGVFDSPTNPFQVTAETAYGGPISDVLAARLALKFNEREPYLINQYPLGAVGPSPGPGAGASLGADDTFAGRGELLYKPSADFSSLFTVAGARSNLPTGPYEQQETIAQYARQPNPSGGAPFDTVVNAFQVSPNETRYSIGPNGQNGGFDPGNLGYFQTSPPGRPRPGGDFFGFRPTQPYVTSSDFAFKNNGFTSSYGFDLKNDWKINDDLTLTSVTDYKKFNKLLFVDVDAGPGNQLSNYAGVDAFTLSQEIRLSGETDRLKWITGLYYLHIDDQSTNGLQIPAGGVEVSSLANLQTNSYSVFGQADWNFYDALTLVAGLRGIDEEKSYKFAQGLYSYRNAFQVDQGFIAPLGPYPDGSPYANTLSEQLWAGKLQLEYRPRAGLLFYVGANRGVKAGSFNAQLAGGLPVPTSYIPYKPEVLYNYEAGFKASLLDDRARLNLAAFHYDYKDYQAFLFTGVSGVVINRNAENNGVQAQLQTSPLRGLDVIVGASYFDARVLDVPLRLPTGQPGDNPALIPHRTVQPVYAPPKQANILLRYTLDAFGGSLSPRADVVYSDSYYYNLRNFSADRYPSYFKVNAGLSWIDATGAWEVSFDVENLTNARIGVQGFDLASLCGCNEVSYELPRFFSLGLHHTF